MKVIDGRLLLHGDAIPWAGYEGHYFCSYCGMMQPEKHVRGRCPKREPGTLANKDLARKQLTEWRRMGRRGGGERQFNHTNLFLMQGRRGD